MCIQSQVILYKNLKLKKLFWKNASAYMSQYASTTNIIGIMLS